MKKIIFSIAISFLAPLMAEALPVCGEVIRDSRPARGASALWLLRGELAEAYLGKISVSFASGIRSEFPFQARNETLIASIIEQNALYLVTRFPRGYALYQLTTGATPALTLIRKEELRAEVGGRQIFSPLQDFHYDRQRGRVNLLGTFGIYAASIAAFVRAPAPSFTLTRLPTAFDLNAPRPVALVPWEGFSTDTSLVFDAVYGGNAPWKQPYGYNLASPELLPDWKDQQGEVKYLANIQNRNSADPTEWLVSGKYLVDPFAGTNILFEAYPYDVFRSGQDMLVNLYEQEVLYLINGEAVCQAFQGSMRSVMIYLQNTPSGPQKVFLGTDENGNLLKTAIFTGP